MKFSRFFLDGYRSKFWNQTQMWKCKKLAIVNHDVNVIYITGICHILLKYKQCLRLGRVGEMRTVLKFSHVTRLDFHSGKSKQIGSHIMMEIHLVWVLHLDFLVGLGCVRDEKGWREGGERAAYEMSWLSQLKCDSWLHVGSNNARACEKYQFKIWNHAPFCGSNWSPFFWSFAFVTLWFVR